MAMQRFKRLGERAKMAGKSLGERMGALRLSVLGLAAALIFGAVLLRGVNARETAVQAQGAPYRTGDGTENKIALTCNVAWGEEFLPQMLETLAQKNVKITFLILGEWAHNRPDDLKLIAEAGHEIGNHGYFHVNHSSLSAKRVQEEIARTADLVQEITGIKPTIFSPPSGDCSEASVKAAREAGQTVILWSIDTIDWRREGKAAILKRVFRDPKAGDIILMHPTKFTAEALPEMIDGLIERGLTPCPVGEILP